jgi:hypothetical protein
LAKSDPLNTQALLTRSFHSAEDRHHGHGNNLVSCSFRIDWDFDINFTPGHSSRGY